MLELVIVLSVIEGFLVLSVLAGFLVAIMRSLRRSAALFGKISFGVRAIDTQTAEIGPNAQRINQTLERIAVVMPDLARRAEKLSS